MNDENFRTQIWNHLANVRFKANYCHWCAANAARLSYFYSLIMSFGSSSSVAAWAIWGKYPSVWAVVVVFMQVLHIVRVHIPFIKQETTFSEMAFKLENLYLRCEKLWHEWENEKITPEKAKEEFYTCREKQVCIEHEGARCPKLSFVIKKVQTDTNQDLLRNLGIGEK